jgi:RNA polymerase sigma-70 factor (ECF subfamily)
MIEDQALAERVSAGDHAAFSLLFERYKAGIYRFCLLMLSDEAVAEDVYQEVFINFYRACRAGQVMHNVRGYLLTAARTRCLNVLRTSNRHVSLEDVPERAYEVDPATADTNVHLRNALAAINPNYREAFLLCEFEGYSYDEIAKQLNVTHDIVKNRIYRAKQALQKILRPLLRDDSM